MKIERKKNRKKFRESQKPALLLPPVRTLNGLVDAN
jgi:hypothetical protein